jgi:hypothetical protein
MAVLSLGLLPLSEQRRQPLGFDSVASVYFGERPVRTLNMKGKTR